MRKILLNLFYDAQRIAAKIADVRSHRGEDWEKLDLDDLRRSAKDLREANAMLHDLRHGIENVLDDLTAEVLKKIDAQFPSPPFEKVPWDKYGYPPSRPYDKKFDAFVLDACCGGKMFYYAPEAECVVYQDIRDEVRKLSDRPKPFSVKPDIIGDFTNMSYIDRRFRVVIFDPPHLWHMGQNSDFAAKYGTCPKDFKPWLTQGFAECFRVLKNQGVLIWKWSEGQIPWSEAVKCSPYRPLFGDQRGKTRWTVFVKTEEMRNDEE